VHAPARRPRVCGARLWAASFAACAFSGSAQAQLGATLSLDSDYRYRGVSLSDEEPSVRATVNYDAPERWYAGISITRAALAFVDTYVQLIGYAGWVAPPVDGTSVEVGVFGSHFAGASGYDFAEAYAGLLGERWSARVSYSPNYYGRHVRTTYVEVAAHAPVGRQGRVFGHVGALVPWSGAAGDAEAIRFDASLGAGWAFGRVDLHVAAVGATRRGPYPAAYSGRRATVVAGVSVAF
jgi:uncharacterized protein (TIGR02001 family)